MANTPSTMVELGTKMPEFELQDSDGKPHGSGELRGAPGVLVVFFSNHCPFVKHIREQFVALAHEYLDKGLKVIAINANDYRAYPDDSPERMREVAREYGMRFPFLLDESQEVAKRFRAACTPDFFLFDGRQELVYRGQMDDSRPGNDKPITGADLRGAIEAVLAGRPVPSEQRPSMGCNIKWKPGNEPDYYGS